MRRVGGKNWRVEIELVRWTHFRHLAVTRALVGSSSSCPKPHVAKGCDAPSKPCDPDHGRVGSRHGHAAVVGGIRRRHIQYVQRSTTVLGHHQRRGMHRNGERRCVCEFRQHPGNHLDHDRWSCLGSHHRPGLAERRHGGRLGGTRRFGHISRLRGVDVRAERGLRSSRGSGRQLVDRPHVRRSVRGHHRVCGCEQSIQRDLSVQLCGEPELVERDRCLVV